MFSEKWVPLQVEIKTTSKEEKSHYQVRILCANLNK